MKTLPNVTRTPQFIFRHLRYTWYVDLFPTGDAPVVGPTTTMIPCTVRNSDDTVFVPTDELEVIDLVVPGNHDFACVHRFEAARIGRNTVDIWKCRLCGRVEDANWR